MFTVNAKSTMLDALTITHASAHTGFPGVTGANEVVGGSYARVAATFAAASAGSRSLSSGINFDIPVGTTVRWCGLWNGSTFLGYAPNAGVPREFIADPSADTITCRSHGYVDTNKIVFYGDTTPAGLTEGVVYFVRDATAHAFAVAATSGGAAIDLTTAGGAACAVSAITEEEYAGGGTHTISAWALGLPN